METLENQITLETVDHLIINEYNNIKDEGAEDVIDNDELQPLKKKSKIV